MWAAAYPHDFVETDLDAVKIGVWVCNFKTLNNWSTIFLTQKSVRSAIEPLVQNFAKIARYMQSPVIFNKITARTKIDTTNY